MAALPSFAPRMFPAIAPVVSLSPAWFTAARTPARRSSGWLRAQKSAMARAVSPVQPPPVRSAVLSGESRWPPARERRSLAPTEAAAVTALDRGQGLLVTFPGSKERRRALDGRRKGLPPRQARDERGQEPGREKAARMPVGDGGDLASRPEGLLGIGAAEPDRGDAHDAPAPLADVDRIGRRAAPAALQGRQAGHAGRAAGPHSFLADEPALRL